MSNYSLQYIDRQTGEVKSELVPGGKMMKNIYTTTLGKSTLYFLFKRKCFSVFGGILMNWSYSKRKIQPFIDEHKVSIDDFIIPEKGFKHFNDFFYRKIQTTKRPIADGIVSPADGKILVFPTIQDSQSFFIKGNEFNLTSFLKNESLAKKYEEGSMAIIRLAPADYHRFHFPVSGPVGEVTKIKGYYYSVSPIALQKNLRIFCENKREYCEVKTKEYGDVLICDVGATLTGKIIQTFQPGSLVEKGQEKGYFAFGGSTTVLLFEKNKIQFSDDLLKNTGNALETTVLMGEKIGDV